MRHMEFPTIDFQKAGGSLQYRDVLFNIQKSLFRNGDQIIYRCPFKFEEEWPAPGEATRLIDVPDGLKAVASSKAKEFEIDHPSAQENASEVHNKTPPDTPPCPPSTTPRSVFTSPPPQETKSLVQSKSHPNVSSKRKHSREKRSPRGPPPSEPITVKPAPPPIYNMHPPVNTTVDDRRPSPILNIPPPVINIPVYGGAPPVINIPPPASVVPPLPPPLMTPPASVVPPPPPPLIPPPVNVVPPPPPPLLNPPNTSLPERKGLLSGIESFNKTKLKKATTVDKSAPNLTIK
eukprot:TRINITY_DN7112_c0_g1_i2.p1 TRINITY_DN7112_c0_g1~~TRINITY_DN7112_c0_g1_i2.p1  ORF type:complete len:291 (-),score=81.12 TRINITY_DN7112_c0_g1_i2:1-873(-)